MGDKIITMLTSSAKIERDKGVEALQSYITNATDDEVLSFQSSALNLLENEEGSWESKQGILQALKNFFARNKTRTTREFAKRVQVHASELLEHEEFRVRMTAAEVVGELCAAYGPDVFLALKEQIFAGIQNNLERKPLTAEELGIEESTERLVEKLGGCTEPKRRHSAEVEKIFHDTAGWKSLETWMKCLQLTIEGCGPDFNVFIDKDLVTLIGQTLTHQNRFVRETGFFVCSAMVGCNIPKDTGVKTIDVDPQSSLQNNAVYTHAALFSQQLAAGLADNWSQVRMAASVAARNFLMGFQSDGIRREFYPVLLAPLCLNRYYVAEGVRIYNQKTWDVLTAGHGRELVAHNIKPVVEFYVSQADADNHAVREAACACISELSTKVEHAVVEPYVSDLLTALLACFHDDSWPVRDAACLACGQFIKSFPEQCRGSMEQLYPLFFENLQDAIRSVRKGAAVSLSLVVLTYGAEAEKIILDKIKQGLNGVADQASDPAPSSPDKETAPATYGVIKRQRDNDADLHTDRVMYSCGSLAPKMQKGTRKGGCMDATFRRAAEPWELADGCVCVLAELSVQQPALRDTVAGLLPSLASSAAHRHYSHHISYLDTVCSMLPVIAKGLGKQLFKRHIEQFFDAIFYSVTCDNALTHTAATECIDALGRFIGPNILRGRVENYNSSYLQYLPPPPPF